MNFNSTDLHDSTVEGIVYNWLLKQLTIEGKKFGTDKGFTIIFEDVSLFSVPHREDWGSSNSINSNSHDSERRYQIEMQSGDKLLIEAGSFSYVE